MAKLDIYLTFNGNCEEAFDFYKSVIGGEFLSKSTFADMPSEHPISEKDKQKIMHMSLALGENSRLMGSDSLESFGGPTNIGNNFSISLAPDNKEEADKLFAGLSVGGTITMPMQNTFWGSYFGSFKDKYDVQWMLNLPTTG